MNEEKNLHPRFFTDGVKDEVASKKEGRPVFKNVEFVEVMIAGNRQLKPIFPAHSVWKSMEVDGEFREITYAERFRDAYRKFKEQGVTSESGTPVEELTFIDTAKRMELRALNIYTAEALAGLADRDLKALGMGGRDLREQAKAYLNKAKDTASATQMQAENDALKQRIAQLEAAANQSPQVEPEIEPIDWSTFTDDEIKQLIKQVKGKAPTGTPSRETLERMANEANAELEAAKKAEQAA